MRARREKRGKQTQTLGKKYSPGDSLLGESTAITIRFLEERPEKAIHERICTVVSKTVFRELTIFGRPSFSARAGSSYRELGRFVNSASGRSNLRATVLSVRGRLSGTGGGDHPDELAKYISSVGASAALPCRLVPPSNRFAVRILAPESPLLLLSDSVSLTRNGNLAKTEN